MFGINTHDPAISAAEKVKEDVTVNFFTGEFKMKSFSIEVYSEEKADVFSRIDKEKNFPNESKPNWEDK